MTALHFVFKTLIDLYLLTFILRFVLQWVRADFYNPLSQFIVKVTNPLVVPLRRIVPSWRGVDMATLALILVLEIAATLALILLAGYGAPDIFLLLYYGLLRTVVAILRLFFFVILVHVILSWVGPGTHNPFSYILAAVSEPLLRPVRRLIPPIAGLDLSPLFVIIGLQALMLLVPLPSLLA